MEILAGRGAPVLESSGRTILVCVSSLIEDFLDPRSHGRRTIALVSMFRIFRDVARCYHVHRQLEVHWDVTFKSD